MFKCLSVETAQSLLKVAAKEKVEKCNQVTVNRFRIQFRYLRYSKLPTVPRGR